MCGIGGWLTTNNHLDRARETVTGMMSRLHHRGPDGSGLETVALGDDHSLVLGHTRLKILDLSPAGQQPMSRGRWSVSYNGEIYNAPVLQRELEDHGFVSTTNCDTEILCHALECWGLGPTLEKLEGMFAFAATDGERIVLARDRIGIKPLYWSLMNGDLVFASELKGLESMPGFTKTVDPLSLDQFLVLGYVPAPQSIYKHVHKLRPGHVLTMHPGRAPDIRQWWSPLDPSTTPDLTRDPVDQLEDILLNSLESHLASDVPVGAFLSGGIDSSLVCALIRQGLGRDLSTFSIGFDESAYDESAQARLVADHLGTDHHEDRLRIPDLLDRLDSVAGVYDEPFADSSCLPTLMLCESAQQQVTVALSGDGGDELFHGYPRYVSYDRLQKYDRIPGALRRLAGNTLDGLLGTSPLGRRGKAMSYVRREQSYGLFVGIFHIAEFCRIRGFDYEQRHGALSPDSRRIDHETSFHDGGPLLDQILYLPDDILTKVDRASMRHSLEVRVPLLDHRVIEFANALPARFKRIGDDKKILLKRLLGRHLPERLWDRPKMGFGIPRADWLRGPLKKRLTTQLDPERLRSQGLLNANHVQQLVGEHLANRRDNSHWLWSLMTLQDWLDHSGAEISDEARTP